MRALMIVLGIMLLANCAPSPTSQGADADEVRAVLTDITAAIASNDAARAAAHYGASAAMYRAREVMIGPEIAEYYNALARSPEGSLEFAPPITLVSASGDMAYMTAVYNEKSVDADGRAIYVEGDVLMVLLREEGEWRIRSESRTPTVEAVR